MDNNQLNRNILKIGMWIFSFFFWYLVVAFFLKSNYPIYEQPFNRKEAYEALRDALTLSAYFLAPAVACILFSDWREQFKYSKFLNEVVICKNNITIGLGAAREMHKLFSSVTRVKEDEFNILNKKLAEVDRANVELSGKQKLFFENGFGVNDEAAKDLSKLLIDSEQFRVDLNLKCNSLLRTYKLSYGYYYVPDTTIRNKILSEIQDYLDQLDCLPTNVDQIFVKIINVD